MEQSKYLVLFFTQYGAINYSKLLKKTGIENFTRPVPRSLSSSCGICIETQTDRDLMNFLTEDVEGIYKVKSEDYELIYRSEE